MRRDPIGYFRGLGFQIGDGCRLIAPTHGMLGTEPALVRIGNDVTISTEVLFVTHDGAVWALRPDVGPVDVYGRIEIADGAFVGARAILLPGIRIGRRAVVGAGAVVSRSVPDNVVVAGAPARILMTIDEYRQRYEHLFHQTAAMSFAEKQSYLARINPARLLVRPELPLPPPKQDRS